MVVAGQQVQIHLHIFHGAGAAVHVLEGRRRREKRLGLDQILAGEEDETTQEHVTRADVFDDVLAAQQTAAPFPTTTLSTEKRRRPFTSPSPSSTFVAADGQIRNLNVAPVDY